jgi:hypothetical protein
MSAISSASTMPGCSRVAWDGRGLLHALPLRLGSPEGHSMTYGAVYSFLRSS